MAFSIKNDEADALVRDLTELTGESITRAVIVSLSERLARERRVRALPGGDPIDAAIALLRAMPILDHRTDEQIIGYDDAGLPA